MLVLRNNYNGIFIQWNLGVHFNAVIEKFSNNKERNMLTKAKFTILTRSADEKLKDKRVPAGAV